MRKKLIIGALGVALAGALVGGGVAYAEQIAQAGDPIATRKENRKQAGAAMRAIKAVLDKGGPVAEAQPQAAKLKELGLAFGKLFPPGSDKGETKVLPVAFTDMAGFQAANKASDDAIDKLAVAIGSGDLKAVTDAYGAVGKSCGACHEKYRAK
jgi:cytochrome c556